MGKNSKIEWTDHTFNPWWGCVRVSPACEHCYAEAWSRRVGKDLWGARADRRFFGDKHWSEPLKWDAQASAAKVRRRVFCASMADVFEKRKDLDAPRKKLWALIESTPHLDWLLLTKRPQSVNAMTHWGNDWPKNVWIGTTVEDQRRANERLPHLALVPAKVRFISAEPLLGAVDLSEWLGSTLNWVIAGGESGPKARPSDPEWFRSLRDQCIKSKTPFHFKQWGDWCPHIATSATDRPLRSSRAGDTVVYRAGKHLSGRLLDKRSWNGLPAVT